MSKIFTIDFTKSFMDELVSYIEQEYLLKHKPLNRLCIVFGGQRPSHFLRRSLAERIQKAFIPPVCLTIDEFVHQVSDHSLRLESLDLNDFFDMYCLIKEKTPDFLKGRESFSSFLPWAKDIVHFIGQLDLECISKEQLMYIQQSSRIGFPVPDHINHMLEHIWLLRESFHDSLRAKGVKTRAMSYLQASDMIQDWKNPFDEIIFANFFYFHRTEEKIIKELLQQGKTTLIFQGDERKWPILERIAKSLSVSLQEGVSPTPTNFNLHVFSAFDEQAQSVVVRNILEKIPDHSKTVVVLPDASGVVSLLSAFPENIKDVNVSMGYPLKRSSLYQLMSFIFSAQMTCKDKRYYTPDYLKVIQHPFVKNLFIKKDVSVTRVIVHKIEEMLKGQTPSEMGGCLFIDLEQMPHQPELMVEIQKTLLAMHIDLSQQEIEEILTKTHQMFFTAFEHMVSFTSFLQQLRDLLDEIEEKSLLHKDPFNGHILQRMKEVLQDVSNISFSQEIFHFYEMARIFEDKISNTFVYFSGTPLKGLQVLGLFETRSLNFEHVIIVDVNEGVLPYIDVKASLIPREVMSCLSLDRLELEEEIQRYQLMRLISSAKNVYLIYQKNKEKESSRFLEELIWEQQKKDQQLKPYPTTLAGFSVNVHQQYREIKKTPMMIEMLKNMTYSATSINAYLKNPYHFYTDYVLGLKEVEDALDEPDSVLIGKFIHSLLEDLYRPWQDKKVIYDHSFEKKMMNLFEKKFHENFEKKIRSDAFLMKKVMKHKMDLFFKQEKQRDAYIEKLCYVEKDFQLQMPLSCGKIRMKGFVDRIDQTLSQELLIIDYKTGSANIFPQKDFTFDEKNFANQHSFVLREHLYEKVKSFQLPLYLFFVKEVFPQQRMNAGLYSLQTMELKFLFKGDKQKMSLEESMKEWQKALDMLMGEILNPDIPFIDYSMEEE